jgi:hypothetical protein
MECKGQDRYRFFYSKVMNDYMHNRFEDHPAVSAVIMWQLAAHCMRSDATGSGDKKFTSVISKVDNLEARVNSLQSNNSSKKAQEGGK